MSLAATSEVGAEDEAPAPGPTLFGRPQPHVADLALGAFAAVALVAYVPGLDRAGAVVLALLVLPAGAAGLVAMVVLASRGERAAWLGLAYLGWAAVSTALAPHPSLAFDVGYAGDRGWIFLAAYLGIWALGRWRGTSAESLVISGLLFGLGLNVILALRQAISDGPGLLALLEGRPMGFLLSSVFLGAAMGGGLVLVAACLARAGERWWPWLGAAAAFALGVNLAGSRIGLVGAVLLGLAAVGRSGWRRVLGFIAAVVVGAAIASTLLSTTGSARVVGGSGFEARTLMWRAGIDAVSERPLVGWGPGRFREATSSATDLRFVRAEGPDRLFFDAHNVLLEQAVAVGLPGLALLGAFAWLAARRARGPLGWFAAGIGLTWLLQPTSIATVPIAMLALGVAGGGPDPEPALAPGVPRVVARTVGCALVLVALAHAGTDVYIARRVEVASSAASPTAELRRAVDLRPADPWVIDLHAQALVLDALDDPSEENRRAVLAAAERAVELEPTYPYFWTRLAAVQVAFGRTGQPGWADARASYEEALRLAPWYTPALEGLFAIALWENRPEDARGLFVALCTIDRCPQGRLPVSYGR